MTIFELTLDEAREAWAEARKYLRRSSVDATRPVTAGRDDNALPQKPKEMAPRPADQDAWLLYKGF